MAGLPRDWFFTPGPTQIHPLVPGALREALSAGLASESHRSEAFRKEVIGTVSALRDLGAIPEGHRVLFVGSATEAMERILKGVVARRSSHLVNGAFARRFHGIAEELGVESDRIHVPDGDGFDLDTVRIPEDAELVAVTENETSTGVLLDSEGIRRLGSRLGDRLLAVDAVTAFPTESLQLGEVDACFFSVQKLFGLPAGLGVLIASPELIERARQLREVGRSLGGFMNLIALAEHADRNETVVTPNALAIHLLGMVARDYLERGVDRIRMDADRGARRITDAAVRAGWTPFVATEAFRSRTILVFDTPADASGIRNRLRAAGFRVGSGYGSHGAGQVRIANFPVQPPEAVESLANQIERL